jgi:uncharacterized membrane protein
MSTYILSTSNLPRRSFEITHLAARKPFEWLQKGWEDLRAAPVAGLSYGLLIAALAAAFAYLTMAMDRFYLVPFLFGGFLIVAPLLSVGLMAMAKHRSEHDPGDTLSLVQQLAVNRSSIGLMGIFLLLVFLNWIMLSNLLFGGVYHELMPMYEQVRPLPVMFLESPAFLAVYGGIAVVLALVLFRITALSLPMLVDQRVDAFNASFASWRAVGENWPAMSVWALLIAALTTVGLLTYCIGLIVIMPWLGFATWHAYRDTLVPQPPQPSGAAQVS